jgi:hypothetical protein
MEASWIIPTSLPPSPMPALYLVDMYMMEPVRVFIFSVMMAFCVGRQRQQITVDAFLAI